MHDKSHESSGESRREFLKKAGAVAWVVPTMQIVNMASASAIQTNGSVVDTTKPRGSTTTTTTTTEPPECVEYKMCRVKADWKGGWHWDSGVGHNDCIQDGDWEKCDAKDMDIFISGDERGAKVTVGKGCVIMRAAHKAGRDCHAAEISNDGTYASFSSEKDISHVELVVKCCKDDDN